MPDGRLTTHVLDTALGRPAAGLAIRLYRLDGGDRRLLASAVTNADGRTDRPLLEGEVSSASALTRSNSRRATIIARRARAQTGPSSTLCRCASAFPKAGAHYHVPLLLSPFGYSTYRGS